LCLMTPTSFRSNQLIKELSGTLVSASLALFSRLKRHVLADLKHVQSTPARLCKPLKQRRRGGTNAGIRSLATDVRVDIYAVLGMGNGAIPVGSLSRTRTKDNISLAGYL
jgi:hypothetical protein